MQATYLEVCATARFWEDATVNGVEDTDGTLMPMRENEHWRPVIRLADGALMNWPQGTTAHIYYKVCDEGEYWLLDDAQKRVAKWSDCYVPDAFLCQSHDGFGDYIRLKIGADGQIEEWRVPEVRMVGSCNDGDKYAWVAVP